MFQVKHDLNNLNLSEITNELNDYVQNQIVSFEEWCNFIFMEYDSSI
jgi:hypothetical protein